MKSGVVKMDLIQEGVMQFIDGVKKQQIMWDPDHPLHFIKISKSGNVCIM
jgi:hypothetical protein